MAKKRKGKKYCPRCGAELKDTDKYCLVCGYSFEKRKKSKLGLREMIIAIIIILGSWILLRIITGHSIIPEPILNLFK